jgi:hypothetical protein
MKKMPKNAQLFCCDICNFNCCKISNYDKHLLTPKHKNRTFLNNLEPKNASKFICKNCNKIYKARNSLWYHEKTCLSSKLETDEEENKILKDEPKDKQIDLIMMLIKENSELKNMMFEQSKETGEFKNIMLEVIKNGTMNNNISNNNISNNNISNNNISNTNTNSHNKAFNLNFFLNETCKNAMNITEFADSIKLQLSDFENVGDVGFITGISNIIIKNLKALDITQRPLHCTDQKREIIYIKDEDKWEKEDDKKQKFHKFLKKIINKNQRLLLKFQEVYPDYNKYSSPNSTRYDKIVIEALGGRGDNNLEKEDKILSIISKTIGINK